MVLSQLQIRVGSNELEFNGSFTLEEVLPLVQQWFAAVNPDAEKLQALAARLNTASADTEAAIASQAATTT